MKSSTMYILLGAMVAGSFLCGLAGYFIEKRHKAKRIGSSLRDLYEDNAPSDRDLAEEYERECGKVDSALDNPCRYCESINYFDCRNCDKLASGSKQAEVISNFYEGVI